MCRLSMLTNLLGLSVLVCLSTQPASAQSSTTGVVVKRAVQSQIESTRDRVQRRAAPVGAEGSQASAQDKRSRQMRRRP